MLCNCNIRPLKHYLSRQLVVPTNYSSVVCGTPAHLQGQNLLNVSDDALQCSKIEKEELMDRDELALLPDLRYREVFL